MRAGHDQPFGFAAWLLTLAVLILLWTAALAASANAETYIYERPDNVEGNLYVQEDGAELRLVPIYVDSPSLAPDGRRIVYKSNGENSDIMMTDVDGHGPHEILPWAAANQLYSNYSWAPDGSELIVSDGDILALRPSSDSWEWEMETIVGWSGEQVEPVISPDGTKIAFFSYTKTSGEPLSKGAALFIANRNGSNVEQLTFGEHVGLGPTFSPDGKKIAFMGLDKDDSFSEIYSLKISNGAVTALTKNSVSDGRADWRSDDRIGYFRAPSSFRVMDSNGKKDELLKSFTGNEYIGPPDWPQIKGDLPTLGSGTKEEATELLLRYSPKLRYDTKDPFHPMSVEPVFKIYDHEFDEPEDSNRLIREGGEVIAYANPDLSNPNLTLDFLQPPSGTYPNKKLVDGDDRLSLAANDPFEADTAIEPFLENPEYRNRTYGRAKYDGGRWWLQYWLFSYYQPPFLPLSKGEHEGDWEMIQIALNEFGQPELATYAQHGGGESCEWDELETSIGFYGNLAPDVYVSQFAHASYSDIDALPVEEETDAEIPIPVQVEEMKDTADWVEWPGVWGDSNGSPNAPSTQGNVWDQPDDFYEEGDSCG